MKEIIGNILTAWYAHVFAALVTSFLLMYLLAFTDKYGVKRSIRLWFRMFKRSKAFRWIFLWVVYIFITLFRTILGRGFTGYPLDKIMENWTVYDTNGEFTGESIYNVLLFMPFTLIAMKVKEYSKWKTEYNTMLGTIFLSGLISSSASVCIELFQILFCVGSLQLSDLCYNTVGGTIGGITYYIVNRIRNRGKTNEF